MSGTNNGCVVEHRNTENTATRVYLSLCELLSEVESVEIRGGKCDLDLVYSSVEALHLCLQAQHVLRRKTHKTNEDYR